MCGLCLENHDEDRYAQMSYKKERCTANVLWSYGYDIVFFSSTYQRVRETDILHLQRRSTKRKYNSNPFYIRHFIGHLQIPLNISFLLL